MLQKNQPRVALIEDNTDTFVSVALAGTIGSLLGSYNQPGSAPSTGCGAYSARG